MKMGPMMARGIYIFLTVLALSGCANFAASLGGTFVGNIASDRVIKQIDKKDNNENKI